MYISSSDSSLNANHKSNCLFDTSTWISNRHLKFIMSETELLIFFPKLSHPMVSPISVNGNSLLHLLRPKALESSSVPISYTSRLVYQQILQTWSYILYWIQPLFATFAAIILVDRNSLLAGLPAAPSSPTSALLHAAKSFGSSCFTQEKKKQKKNQIPIPSFTLLPAHSAPASLLLLEQAWPTGFSFRACALAVPPDITMYGSFAHFLQISARKSPGSHLKQSTFTFHIPLLYFFIFP